MIIGGMLKHVLKKDYVMKLSKIIWNYISRNLNKE
jgi:hypothetical protein